MDYSEELSNISKPAYRLQKVGHLLCTVAFVAIVLLVLLSTLGLINELAGLSARPRGPRPFVWLMASAPFVGGLIAACGLFLKYTSDWMVHRRGLRYEYASNSYVLSPTDSFPFKQCAAMLLSCVFLHIPRHMLRWWRALPD